MNSNAISRLRSDAITIWNAGVDAVRAEPLVAREVVVDGEELHIGDSIWSRGDFDRLIVVGAGKATAAMTAGLIRAVGDWLPVKGWINVPEGTEQPLGGVHVHVARPAGINEPTEAGVVGARAMMRMMQEASARDLSIALISGGGSALLPLPVAGVSLDDKRQVTRLLSSAGANIVELNTVRKHLSEIKGGGLLAACRSQELVTLVLSDVLGDPLELIASGPTVPDRSTPEEALQILHRFDPHESLPTAMYAALRHPPHRPRATAVAVPSIVGNNAVAVDAAGIRAESLGYNHAMQSARQSEGPAEHVGQHLADLARQMMAGDSGARESAVATRINCLVTGGEPTVSLVPASQRGRGGRNQQLVLAAYVHLLERTGVDFPWHRFALLSGGTDGEDGPTDAAGAVLDAAVHDAAQRLQLDPRGYLARNDAYSFFQHTGGLLITGPTGTNVCDLRVLAIG